jgi:SAM-dependent methyltransferase
VVGVDPAPGLLTQARELSAYYTNLSFEEGDGRALAFPDASFDVVVLHTVLCHVPGPEQCVEEAFRLLRPGGWVAIFDNDPMTATVATGEFDPLQACVAAMVQSAGFHIVRQCSHGSVETTEGYFVTILDRGADLLVAQGRIGAELAEALKAEARRRITAGQFFGHFAYVSLVAQKPID